MSAAKLPEWCDVYARKQAMLVGWDNGTFSPLEAFVWLNQPSRDLEAARLWRNQLQSAIDSAIEQSQECPADCKHRRGRHCGNDKGMCIRSASVGDLYERGT
jgi:hypothetical protein